MRHLHILLVLVVFACVMCACEPTDVPLPCAPERYFDLDCAHGAAAQEQAEYMQSVLMQEFN